MIQLQAQFDLVFLLCVLKWMALHCKVRLTHSIVHDGTYIHRVFLFVLGTTTQEMSSNR